MVTRISSIDWYQLESYYDTIHSKLVTYEHKYHRLKDAAFLLELALWKTKITEQMHVDNMDDTANMRGQFRVNCGAAVVIPNVLPFLIDE